MLGISPETFETVQSIKTKQHAKEVVGYSIPQRDFVPFTPEFYVLADKTEESNFDIPDLGEFIAAKTVDIECRLAETTVGKPKTSFAYNTNGVLVKALSVDGAS